MRLISKHRAEIILQELKEAYYAELSASKATKTATADPSEESKPAKGKSKPLVKKKVADDPFASDDETDSKGGKSAKVGGKRKVREGETERGSNASPVKKKNM